MNAPAQSIDRPEASSEAAGYSPVNGGYPQNLQLHEDDIDLREYFRIIDRSKWKILGLVLVCTMIAAQVVYSLDPVYRSTVSLLIEPKEQKAISIEEVYGLPSGRKEYFETQFQILKSRNLAEQVVLRLDLVKHRALDPRQQSGWRKRLKAWLSDLGIIGAAPTSAVLADKDVLKSVVARVQSGIHIEPVQRTQLVQVSFESTDAALAADIVNELADVYIEGDMEARLQMTRKATDWLKRRLGGLREQLDASERKLQQYREKHNLVDLQGVTTLSAKELDNITGELVASKRERAKVESFYKQIRNARKNGSNDFSSLPAVLQDPAVVQLRARAAELEQKIAELSKRYGDRHPKMQQAFSEREELRNQTALQVQQVAVGIEKEFAAVNSRVKDLERQLNGAKWNFQSIARKEIELRELERDVESNRQLYEQFFTRIKETSETGNFQSAHARIVDPALVNRGPVKPRKRMILGMVVMFSAMAGVLITFLVALLDNTFKGSRDVEEKLGTAVFGVLPLLKQRRKDKPGSIARAYFDTRHRTFAESVRTIRTGLVLSGLDTPHKVILVTSSVPGEGKTTLATNLGLAFSQLEKTLIIDADMRRPSLGKILGQSQGRHGLSNLVAGNADWDGAVLKINENLDAITAGILPPNPLELLQSKRFAKFMQDADQRYDRIVIDSAPVQAVSDSLFLSTYANALIYVVKADSTNCAVVKEGIERLRKVRANISGVVLNQLDVVKAGKYGYYSGYYDQYGYSDQTS